MALRIYMCSIARVVTSRLYCSGISVVSKTENDSELSEPNFTPTVSLKNDENKLLQELKRDVSAIFIPAVPQRTASITAFVSKSESLQNLVKLGVDLSKIDKDQTMSSYLIKSDFKTDIQPYILFLYDQKVNPLDMGHVFTKNPLIFKEPMDNLQLRIDYFKSKNFSHDSIVRIISKEPSVLTTSTLVTDKQLGYLQGQFRLTGDEVRELATMLPKMIVWDHKLIEMNKHCLTNVLGFRPDEVKTMLLNDPRLLIAGSTALSERFDYLHNTMGFSHDSIMVWPTILRTRLHIVKNRHQFLQFIKRDQFDNKSENYVSLKALVSGSDEDFCNIVGKVPVTKYRDFLKTL